MSTQKLFCYLEQGKTVNHSITLAKKGLFDSEVSDFYRLNWYRDDDPNAFVMRQGIYWSEGRSLLYELVPKRYDYYIFADEDIVFHPGTKTGILAGIERLLEEFRPLSATFYDPSSWSYLRNHGYRGRGHRSLRAAIGRWIRFRGAVPIFCHDQQVHVLHKDVADFVFPVPYHGSERSMHYVNWLLHKVQPRKMVCSADVTCTNEWQDPHEEGIKNRRVHARMLMRQFNKDCKDRSFDWQKTWSGASIRKKNMFLLFGPSVDKGPAQFSTEDVAGIFNIESNSFRSRAALRPDSKSRQ